MIHPDLAHGLVFASDVVRAAEELNATMRRIHEAHRLTDERMADLKRAALELSQRTTLTWADAAQALAKAMSTPTAVHPTKPYMNRRARRDLQFGRSR